MECMRVAFVSGGGGVADRSRSAATVHAYRPAAGNSGLRARIGSFDPASFGGEETRPPEQSCSRPAPAQPYLSCLIKKEWGQSRLSPLLRLRKSGAKIGDAIIKIKPKSKSAAF